MSKKKTQSKTSKVLGWLKPNSPAKGMLLFAIVFAVIGGSYAAYKSFAATPCVNQVFRQGSSGPCVDDIQGMLNFIETAYPNNCGLRQPVLKVDGKYGSLTYQHVRVLQFYYNCVGGKVSVDGVTGSQTWKIFCDLTPGPNFGPPYVNSYYKSAYLYHIAAGCQY